MLVRSFATLPAAIVVASSLACLAVLTTTSAVGAERKDIPDKYKWRLSDLYPSEGDWTQAKEDLGRRIPGLARHRGRLGESPQALWSALDDMFGLDRELSRLAVYASSLSDQDVRAARPREMRQSAETLVTDLASASAFMRPEILTLPPAKIRAFLARDARLLPYRFYLEETLRQKPHTLSAGEERVAAEAGEMARAGGDVFGVLSNADLPYPTVKLASGEAVRLDSAAYSLHRQSRVRADRDAVFTAYFGALATYERTLGETLSALTRAHLFEKKIRNFGSTLEASLFRDNIPVSVYRQLLADVHGSLPTLHRYLKLRQRLLGLDVMRYQDLYVPLVDTVDLRYEPDQARAITLGAVAPLGASYVEALRKGFDSGWTDYLPSTGKRSGAYSTGVYGVHPYQLLNFNGRYEDLTTLAHEAGHSMHTWLSYEAQPYPTSGYAMFVAEVASTLNENLLVHHLLDEAHDDATRLFLLGQLLDGLRTTLFRQTQFAAFELAFHEQVEKGTPLTGEGLSALYLKMTREFYGHDKGICRVDDFLRIEWAYVPHFYYDFYVYQYATSMVASTALARAIREEAARGGSTPKRDAYLRLLGAGGSRYPIDLLKDAGVDMTTSGPFNAAIAEMNTTMDEMERVFARQPKAKVEGKAK